ncbi:MAG: AraC family transcriptional regulator [Ferruginibacter sp.]|nr:AraC family transcriptional regulator [Ferruginibacter sp.]
MTNHYPKIYFYKRIVQAKIFMDTHFGEAIDLHNIADEAYFSKFHFIRLFKTVYGNTPHQYLTKVRIEAAKMLLQKQTSMTETCFAVGFDSISSFSGLFKKYTKTTPSTYQQQFKKRQAQIKLNPLQFIPGCFAQQKGWMKKAIFKMFPEETMPTFTT